MTGPDGVTGGQRLAGEGSPFLRHGATQPVHWWPWGEAAFEEARAGDRPVLLDIGAVWCHWCHVMDRESYEDAETAALINRLFVPIKVDRDARPDVDARYQRAVQVLTGQGGWPLTAFLTPEGDVFYGGTYFPPIDSYGRPSFRRVLLEVARVWKDDRRRASEAVAGINTRIEEHAQAETQSGELRVELIDDTLEELANAFDFRYGGFGRSPKFPNPGGIDLLLDAWLERGTDWARRIVVETLNAMGRGGIFDQLGGGFHRYATDARWIIPHFEKMAYDNGPLLASYAAAASALSDPFFAEVASGIVQHYVDVAPALLAEGGFPASQDADFSATDDGDYWTWTEAEVGAVLGAGVEFEAVRLAYGLEDPASSMHVDASRHVLFRALEDAQLGEALGTPAAEARAILDRARGALKAERDRRPAPFVDTSLYAGWTALVISGHLAAARYLDNAQAGEAALRALDRVWDEGFDTTRGVRHRVADAGSGEVLEDQAFLLLALLDAFELTQQSVHLQRAQQLAAVLAQRFREAASGAFRDRPAGSAPVRTLDRVVLPIADSPTPSGNGAAALALLRLAEITGDDEPRDLAEGVLRAFAGSAARLQSAAATYHKALAWAVLPVTTVIVVDDAAPADSVLLRAALRTARPRTVVRLIAAATVDAASLPEALRAMVTRERPRAYVCADRACAAPVSEPEALREVLRTFRGA